MQTQKNTTKKSTKMEFKDLEKTLDRLNSEVSEQEERERILEMKLNYSGSDEVVSALDYHGSITKEAVLYKVLSKIPTLDAIIEGFRPGNLIMVSGPTKQGKTTFCQTLTQNFTEQGYQCLWFSFDTPPIELIERFPKMPTFFLPRRNKPEKTLDWIEEKAIEGLAKFGTRIVFVDHLESLAKFSNQAPNYSVELTSIVNRLKEIAMQWNLTIFLNHHIRGIDANTVPNWSHMKNTSGAAQESDLTIMIWRERMKSSNPGEILFADSAVVSVQLHRRTGKTGNVRVKWKNNLFYEVPRIETTDSEF